jgi:hypothetical protein
VFVGEIAHHGQWLPGAHEALVSEEQWQKAQCRRQGEHPPQSIVPGRYLLPRVRCAHYVRPNGALLSMHGYTRKQQHGYELSQFSKSRSIEAAPADELAPRFPRRVAASVLESAVLSAFLAPPPEPDNIPPWWLEIQQRSAANVESDQSQLADKRAELVRLGCECVKENQRLDRALDYGMREAALARGERIKEIEAAIASTREEVCRLESRIESTILPVELPQQIAKQINVIQVLHDTGDRAALRDALESIIENIVLSIDEAGELFCDIHLKCKVLLRRGSLLRLPQPVPAVPAPPTLPWHAEFNRRL